MTVRFESFLAKLQHTFPSFPVVTRKFSRRDDPGVEHLVHILGVPHAALSSVASEAWDLAFALYGNAPVPFLLTTLPPETSAVHFPSTYGECGITEATEVNPTIAVRLRRKGYVFLTTLGAVEGLKIPATRPSSETGSWEFPALAVGLGTISESKVLSVIESDNSLPTPRVIAAREASRKLASPYRPEDPQTLTFAGDYLLAS